MDSERIGASGANEYFHAFLPRNFGHKDLQNTWHKDGKIFEVLQSSNPQKWKTTTSKQTQ